MAVIKVQLLGGFSVALDGTPVEFRGALSRSLVALLALSAGRPLTADSLINRLWDDRSPDNPRPTLHSAIARLRRVLGESAISSERGRYCLQIDPGDVDVLRMLGQFEAAGNETDSARRYELLAQGLAMWPEPLRDESAPEVPEDERTRLIERYLGAFEARVDLDLALARHDLVSAELRDLADRYPLRESLWSRLIRALAGSGRRAEALGQYDRVRRHLAEELGVDPGEELRAAFTLALTADAAEACADPMIPWQLPPRVARFGGRSEVLADLHRLLGTRPDEAGANAGVILHGPPGVGKTSLAVQWAHQAGAEFPDGCLFVDLRGYGQRSPVDPADALHDLLRSLGVPADAVPASTDARTAEFRTAVARRRILLVLDDARNADQVRPLLPGGSAFVVITSRHRLDGLAARDDFRQVSVAPLSPQESRAMLAGSLRPGVAGADRPDRWLTELAELCGHLPLALAVAAGQANRQPELGVEQLVQDLRSAPARLDLLRTGDDDAADVRVIVDRSYRALDPDCAALFRALAASGAQSVSTPCAVALGGLGDAATVRALRKLTDLHLVQEPRPGRFTFHSLLGVFAAEQALAVDGEAGVQAVLGRLLDWYLATLRAAATVIGHNLVLLPEFVAGAEPLGFASDREAHAWFELEYRDIVSAVGRAAENGHPRKAAMVGVYLWQHLTRKSALSDSFVTMRTAASAARAAGDPLLEAIAANQLATCYGRAGEYAQAVVEIEHSRALFLRLGNLRGQMMTTGNLGLALRRLGRLDEAVMHLNGALDDALEAGSFHDIGVLSNNLANAQRDLGHLDDAYASATRSVRTHRELADWDGLTFALHTCAEIALRRDQPDEARALLEEALELSEREQLPWSKVEVLVTLGHALTALTRLDDAHRSWQQALDELDRLPTSDRHATIQAEDIQKLLVSGLPIS
ncbi:DNA-binding SARP family transcriptional activator [Kribbella amoyensis]|uniref:DNA-binding SARP family transcriptional activator n=1 Tax=Kribbella amoyensis TaxID=996641 RepID=A0A561B3K0_9ACTN|nr:BTAD domain-containing putative transcriptional regulator [Kribbella amoyensis]TWD73443.1 DNA-binding SARP family transcriptional activator [Kribbella amoyensis]